MNYWLHRISHQAELAYPLLEKGFLTIGFSDFTNQEFIDKVAANNWNYFNKQFSEKWGKLPRNRHDLWRFLNFKKGDIVIIPSWGTFWVCQILDDTPLRISEAYSDDLKTWGNSKVEVDGNYLTSESGKRYDLGFARKIKVIHKKVSREKFADARLTSRMKIRQTNSSLNDLTKSIEGAIANYKENKPIHLHSVLLEKTSGLVLDSIKSELNPAKFEKLVGRYFKTIGANEVSIPAKNERNKEGDADIVAVFERLKLIVYIQAKFQHGEIDAWGANQILEYKTNRETMDDGYNKIAWVITTANTYNEAAKRIAAENEIQLITGLEFSEMLLDAGLQEVGSGLAVNKNLLKEN